MNFDIESLYAVFKRYPKVCTDSRKVEEGCLFFALKGDRFDGNLFAATALKKGAAVVVVSDPTCVEEIEEGQFILVPDTLVALQKLARHHRRQFTFPVIGITGSNGKTTTKELCAAVLAMEYKCHFTQGNFNNHIGVPLTLLAMEADTEIAIIEMGANHVGEIAALCRIAEPTHGLITNVGKAHIEGFGSLEGVRKGKGELYAYLNETHGLVFINTDEKFLRQMAKHNRKVVTYQRSKDMSPSNRPLEAFPRANFPFVELSFLDKNGNEVAVKTQISGSYNFNNLMTAIALGKYFKVPAEKIKTALENYLPENNRSQLVQKGKRTYIMDAYNANPSSMCAALKNFAEMPDERPKYAILGDMYELGEDSLSEHNKILRQATCCADMHVLSVGAHFYAARGRRPDLNAFEHIEELKAWLEAELPESALILVKGSRGMRLEQILNA